MLENLTRVPLLITLKKEEEVLEMIDGAAAMDFPAEAKRAVVVSGHTMNKVCYKYDADLPDLEKLQKAASGKN